jgi:hypothetical protein
LQLVVAVAATTGEDEEDAEPEQRATRSKPVRRQIAAGVA